MPPTPIQALAEAILHLQDAIANISPGQPPHLLAIVLSREDLNALHSFERRLRMDLDIRHTADYHSPLPNVIVTLESTHVMKEPRYVEPPRSIPSDEDRYLFRNSNW